MTQIIESEVTSTTQVKTIYTPMNIPEEMNLSGFAFSKRLVKQTGLKVKEIPATIFQGKEKFPFADLARQMESDSDGGATVHENSIQITVADDHPNASSNADSLWMYFTRGHRVRLHSSTGSFTAGASYTWDLNDVGDWLEDHIKTDYWDEIGLKNDSNDGVKIRRIRIIHSSQTILDWTCNAFLDASRMEPYSFLVLTAKILETKLNQVGNTWIPQIHWAAREIGKTDGRKYGALPGEKWCSEFASWCLRKGLWPTPTGNIGSGSMEDCFEDLGRKFTHNQLINGDYQLHVGDYIRFEWEDGGHHSGIFIEYIDDPANPTNATTVRTIEGNASSTVKVARRVFKDILSVGNCR